MLDVTWIQIWTDMVPKRKVVESIILALSVKFIVLVLGLFGMSTIYMAVFADVGVTLIAVLNSMRIIR